jgi:drug/metabolite transporter (DMT)-like permease
MRDNGRDGEGAAVATVIFGIALVVIGAVAAADGLNLTRRFARAHNVARSDRFAHELASTSFLVRFVGLLCAAAGLAQLGAEFFG